MVGNVPVPVQLSTEIQYSVSVLASTELGTQYSVPKTGYLLRNKRFFINELLNFMIIEK